MSGTDYAAFIWSAYGASALVVAALVIRAVVDHRVQLRALRRLDAGTVQDGARLDG